MKWLGQRYLEPLLRETVSLIARRDAAAARALLPDLEVSGLPGAGEGRERVRAVLRTAAVLDSVMTGRPQIFRSAPHQLRDWARALFRERRILLARPP
jgi:hypothetical protein